MFYHNQEYAHILFKNHGIIKLKATNNNINIQFSQ